MSTDQPIPDLPVDPTAEPDATQSMAQGTPPTQALPEWAPPYPQTPTVAIGDDTPPQPPRAPYGYAPPPPQAPYGYAAPPQAYAPAPVPQHGYAPPPSALPQYGVPPVAYSQPQQTNVSALVLTILSGMLVFSCYFTLAGIAPLILGIIALTKQNTDWEGSRRMARTGWIVLAIMGGITLLGIIGFIVFAAMNSSSY